MKKDIFISYRRKGAKTEAVLLYTLLKQKGYRVFLDFDSLHSGKFSEEIRETIAGCTDFILLIHPTAFNRCSEANDCFTMEVECALRENKNIIPILLNQRTFPTNIPKELEGIKDFNGIQFLPLEYADTMVSRLINQYLTVQPAEAAEPLPEPVIPQEEPGEDPLEKWINLREDQWKKCAVCGSLDVELYDAQGEFRKELEEIAQIVHYIAILAVLTIPLILLLLVLCQIPACNTWVLGYLQENNQSVLNLLNTDFSPTVKALIGFGIPLFISCAAIFTRNILRQYVEIMDLREEEDYYKSQCTCNSCRASFYTEIPTWNLAKEKTEKTEFQTALKIGYLFVGALFFFLIFWISDIGSWIFYPDISWLAWPILAVMACAGCLIAVMIKYEKVKNY